VKILKLLIVSLFLVCCALLSAQSDLAFRSLEERMTGKEFMESGLHKLSPEELETLNRWIRERLLAQNEVSRQTGTDTVETFEVPQPPKPTGRPGRVPEIDRMPREKLQSRIVGKFSGWSGETEFELENGMVWKQKENDRFYIQSVENPVVTIKPGLFGSWRLSIEGYKSAVRVERIK